jgi:hypothetical protein
VLDDPAGALGPPRAGAGTVLTRECDRTGVAPGDRAAPRPAVRASGAGEAALLLLRELFVGEDALLVQFAQLLELREHRL